MTDQEKHLIYLIEHNPIEKVFPITHKSNHGISLAIWHQTCLRIGLNVIFCDYSHHFGPGDDRIMKQLRLTNL